MQSSAESERRAFVKVATASLSCALENAFHVLHSTTEERQMLLADALEDAELAVQWLAKAIALATPQLNHSEEVSTRKVSLAQIPLRSAQCSPSAKNQ